MFLFSFGLTKNSEYVALGWIVSYFIVNSRWGLRGFEELRVFEINRIWKRQILGSIVLKLERLTAGYRRIAHVVHSLGTD